MGKKALILLMVLVFGLGFWGCAGIKPSPTKILPISVTLDSIERLNDIAPNPPYQKWDSLTFKVNLKLSNPNNALAKVSDLYFELKVDDGTPDKTILLAGSMPSGVIEPGGEMTWSYAGPYIYGAVLGSYALRGVGGEEGLKGVIKKLNELWEDLGKDKREFFIDGNLTYYLPEFPNLGTARNQFKIKFTMPKL